MADSSCEGVEGEQALSFSDEIYRQDDSFVSRRIEDEVILVPIRQNVADLESIYTLNEVAAHIWEQMDGQKTTGQIATSTVEEFNVTAEEVQRDLQELVQQLTTMGAITKV
jgi:hypothetical protein